MSKESLVASVLPKLAPVIRAAAGLASNDVNFYKSLDQGIAQQSTQSSQSVLKLINEIASSVESGDAHEFDDKSIESWTVVSNLLDTFLERSDMAFDGLRKKKSAGENSTQITYLDDSASVKTNETHQKRQEKPQEKFSRPVDNNEVHPFKPLLTSKPHAVVPFEETFKLTEQEEYVPSHYRQPYETEIMNQDYNEQILEAIEPKMYEDWESTDAIWVNTVETLKQMLDQLEKASEIAVDLEHHDYRSYYGIVCLMQISTRDQDWLIDTLALRDELQILNSVFADPMITKVFHGAFMDIIWLQRDLGIYVVSLFDTYHASRQLGFPKHSLAYLLERFAHFKTSKKYQLADWRIRPLTRPMRAYARSDTHFLLYIFDNLRNMLLENNKLGKVLFESRNVAVRRYEYSSFRPTNNQQDVVSLIEKADPWKSLLYQYNLPTSRAKIVETLYQWRDSMARKEDESPRYIMPNQILVSLASLAPTDSAGVLASSNMITEHVRKNCKTIADLISRSLKETELEDLRLMNDATKDLNEEDDVELTVDTVLHGEEIFKSMLKSRDEGPHFKKESQLLSHDVIEKKDDVSERRELINTALNKFSSLSVLESTENVDEDETVGVEEQQEQEGIVEDSNAPSKMFEDKEDVIVLKKKQQQETKVDNRILPKGEAFDYTKAEKIIKPTSREKFTKKRPSNQFDPYTKESEGPRPAKKQSKPHQGKTASFSNKKKRS
jgi:exosome complex exonuclease RRP6